MKFPLSIKKGLSFGLASGVVTTLGLIVGLHAGTESRLVIISGILVIALADALSDAMGIHFSEETEKRRSERHIWKATIATFFAKFLFALSFIIPVWFLELNVAIIVSIVYGLALISIFSLWLAHVKKQNKTKILVRHLSLAIVVIILSGLVGRLAELIV